MSVYRPDGYETYLVKVSLGGVEYKFPGTTDRSATREIERHVKRLDAVRANHDAIPFVLADWIAELPARFPKLYQKLVEAGIIPQVLAPAVRPLMELLYGVIESTSEFEAMVKKYHRNGNTEEDARLKAMALHPKLYKTKEVG